MEQTVASDAASAMAKAQRVRFNRILGGAASYALTAAIVTVCWSFGYLDGAFRPTCLTPQGHVRFDVKGITNAAQGCAGATTLKTPYRDGTTHILLEPLDF